MEARPRDQTREPVGLKPFHAIKGSDVTSSYLSSLEFGSLSENNSCGAHACNTHAGFAWSRLAFNADKIRLASCATLAGDGPLDASPAEALAN